MAGAVRYLIQRGDAFWARIVVPADLREIIGKTELRAPLGSNRKLAERALHAAVAEMHDLLAAARGKLNVSALPTPRTRSRSRRSHTRTSLRNWPLMNASAREKRQAWRSRLSASF